MTLQGNVLGYQQLDQLFQIERKTENQIRFVFLIEDIEPNKQQKRTKLKRSGKEAYLARDQPLISEAKPTWIDSL